jgi:hypothetical protein
MGWTIGVLGFDSRRGLGIFLFTTVSSTDLGPTQPTIQWVPGAFSVGVKRPGRETDHSPPSRSRSRMRGAIPPLHQYVFMAWCLVKHTEEEIMSSDHKKQRKIKMFCTIPFYFIAVDARAQTSVVQMRHITRLGATRRQVADIKPKLLIQRCLT